MISVCKLAGCLLMGGIFVPALAAEVTIELKHGKSDTIEVLGVGADRLAALKTKAPLGQQLRVYVHGSPQATPLFGQTRIQEERVVFEPRFPLQGGLTYRVEWTPHGSRTVRRLFAIPAAKPHPPAKVAQVFPTRDVLPENQLKFYIHFSAPMSRGNVYQHISLLGPDGQKVPAPFLEVAQELWDSKGQRFTLFFDPGRVKRGLRPREEMGPALEEGKSYQLVIDKAWRDAHGQELAESYTKRFRVMAPDYQQPATSRWEIKTPAADSEDPLQVVIDEPLDHALLSRVVTIAGANGNQVPGEVVVDRGETRLLFRPEQPWQSGTYAVVMDTILEDLAGNSIARPFEVDIFEKVDAKIEADLHRVWFVVK